MMSAPLTSADPSMLDDEHSDVHEQDQRDPWLPHARPVTSAAAEDQRTAMFRAQAPSSWPRRTGSESQTAHPPIPSATYRPHAPPQPPLAAATSRTGRSLWFVPSLIAAVVLCVAGVLALVRLGPASPHVPVAHSLPIAAAPASPETPQEVAAAEPAGDSAASPGAAVKAGGCPAPSAQPPVYAAPETEGEDNAWPSPLERKHSRIGLLRIKSNVPAAVYLDGHFVGKTPLHGLSVAPGEHAVALENAVTDQRTKFSIFATAGSTIQRHVWLARPKR